MKRIARGLLAALLALLCAAPALAQVVTDGTVECGRSVMLTAQAGGTVAEVCVQAGSWVSAGDTAARLATTPVYAPWDGTVSVIFADASDSADDATAKYGGVLTLAPENQYVMYATSEYAYKSARTSRIAAGQTVYMKCTADGTHRGTGVITGIDGEIFTIEATGGAFYNGETVYVYMESDYDTVDRLGKATVVATSAMGVAGTGGVARLYVEEGDFVEKGQLLFETLDTLPEGGTDDVQALTVDTSGYVVEVYAQAGDAIERDAPLLALCPADALIAVAQVPDSDLAGIRPGDAAELSFELAEETLRVTGTISDIAYLPSKDTDAVAYDVRIAFAPDPRILPGMTATVTLG